MNQVLMIPPEKLGKLTNLYKERITSDPTLTTATQLAATRHKVLANKNIPPAIKKAKVKALNSTFNKTLRKYKEGPFTSNIIPDDTTDSIIQQDEQSKAFQKLLLSLLRGQPQAKKTSIISPKTKTKKKTTAKKARKTEAEKLISDWLPYDTRTQRWQKRTRTRKQSS